ncbi:Sodium-coupled monocarboxylate transporter 1 [Chionoecetes opilio]|uniref:Sodium-coupled monocarboxylate transporter 1 n=1 Tax=Chionoecetes opilio TaxID=41210 RepID=A0A8J5BUW9_CHIOP|nr:Sodium-coupled monocarboxylate transporter 1 [Chionoecetes opilio]
MSATHFGPHSFSDSTLSPLPFGLTQVASQTPCFRQNLQISKGLMWFFLPGFWCMWILFFFSGMVAYAVYSTCDPLTSGKIKKADQIIPFLVTDKLGHIPGVSGLFMAAVYGAVLSTFSSMGNSAACVLGEDFLKPLSYFKVSGLLCHWLATGVINIKPAAPHQRGGGRGNGMLLGNLGSIFHILHGVTTAITVRCVEFSSGASYFPGSKLSYCVWIVVGKFLRGAKTTTSPAAPRGDCGASSIANFSTTLDPFTILKLHHLPVIYTETPTPHHCSGPPADDVEGGLVNPTCERLCKRVWGTMRHIGECFVMMGWREGETNPEGLAEGTTNSYEDPEAMTTFDTIGYKFQAADWVVFSLMLVVSVTIGVISAVRDRRKVTTQEFLLGG